MKSDHIPAKKFDTWKIASPAQRITAQVIDQGLVSFVVIFAMALWFPDKAASARWFFTLVVMWMTVSTITQAIFIWLYGNTPGKKSVGLILQPAQPQGGRLRLSQVVVRSFTWWLGLLTLGTGWCSILNRNDRRAWHDVASNTVVVSLGGEPSYPATWEKKWSERWLTFVALFLGFLVLSVLVHEMKILRAVDGEGESADVGVRSDVKAAAWLVLAGQVIDVPQATPKDTDTTLFKLITLFSKARSLPLAERYSFYKANMETLENQLCDGERESACQSAHLMTELLSPRPTNKSYPKALQPLQMLKHVELLESGAQKASYFQKESKHFPVYSNQNLALSTAYMRALFKTSEFAKAYESAEPLLGKIKNPKADFAAVFIETSCQALAFDKCQIPAGHRCLDSSKWMEWSAGCTQSLSDTRSAMLGHWWSLIRTKQIKNETFAHWEENKKMMEEPSSQFEKEMIDALDFMVNVSVSPKNVMSREKKVSPENPLWGAVHRHALEEFGDQWRYIIYPMERSMLETSGVFPHTTARTLASEKPPTVDKPILTPQLTIAR